MKENNLKTLYLCYFGLREPLVQTQVLSYLRELTKLDGLKISLLTFEADFKKKWTAEQISAGRRMEERRRRAYYDGLNRQRDGTLRGFWYWIKSVFER